MNISGAFTKISRLVILVLGNVMHWRLDYLKRLLVFDMITDRCCVMVKGTKVVNVLITKLLLLTFESV